MKIVKDEIRPVGYVTLELNERELQIIYDLFWHIGLYQNILPEDMKGTRGKLYQQFSDLLDIRKERDGNPN